MINYSAFAFYSFSDLNVLLSIKMKNSTDFVGCITKKKNAGLHYEKLHKLADSVLEMNGKERRAAR